MKKFKQIFQDFLKPNFDTMDFTNMWASCATGDLDKVVKLFEKKKVKKYDFSPAHLFEEVCQNGHLNVAQYLLTSPKTTEFHNLHVQSTGWIQKASRYGHMELIKYLFTSPELKQHPDIHFDNDIALVSATQTPHFDLVKFLLSSPDLKEHADIHANKDVVFKRACKVNDIEMLEYLVFDLNIEKTDAIKDFLESAQKFANNRGTIRKIWGFREDDIEPEVLQHVNKIFDARDLEKELSIKETPNNNKPKRPKI